MTDDRLGGAAITAGFDQLQATLTSAAPMWGAYFRALLENGCDETLARQLVLNAHHTFHTIAVAPGEDADA